MESRVALPLSAHALACTQRVITHGLRCLSFFPSKRALERRRTTERGSVLRGEPSEFRVTGVPIRTCAFECGCKGVCVARVDESPACVGSASSLSSSQDSFSSGREGELASCSRPDSDNVGKQGGLTALREPGRRGGGEGRGGGGAQKEAAELISHSVREISSLALFSALRKIRSAQGG